MKNKEKFLKLIKKKIFEGTPEVQAYVKNKLVIDGRLTIYKFDELIHNNDILEYYDIPVLIWIAEALYSFDNSLCNVNEFFEPIEIEDAKFYISKSEDIGQYLVIKNVKKIAPFQFNGLISVAQVAMLKKYDIIKTNFEIQRDSKVKKYGNTEIRLVNVNQKRVNEIEKLIADDNYIYNDIKFNLLKDSNGLPEINYNSNNGTILLDKDSLIVVLDGGHRVKSCEFALLRHPEKIGLFHERFFTVKFTNETIMGCKRIVDQEWNREPVPKSQMKAMTRTDSNIIVEMIMSSDNADPIYSKKIVNSQRDIKNGTGFILLPLLSDAIERYYGNNNIKTLGEKQKLKQWLEIFFNEIVIIFQDDFINFNFVKQNKWNVSPYAWYLFIGLSNKLKDEINWQNSLTNILNKINWDISAFPYKECNNSEKKIFNLTNEILRECNND